MTVSDHDRWTESRRANWVRLQTLVMVRWIAIAGQLAAIAVASGAVRLDLKLGPCLAAVALSAAVNLGLSLILPVSTRLTERQVTLMLLFDIVQLFALVSLSGGLNNPFVLLVLAPVTIAATALSLRSMLVIVGTSVALVTLVAKAHVPLRKASGDILSLPSIAEAGFWAAIVISIVFVALYVRRVSLEIHTMSQALFATRMALAREQKLTDLSGVVAAAAHELGTPLATIKLASAELMTELGDRPELLEDAKLIRDQADRCRDILRTMGRAGKRDSYTARAPLSAVVREAAEPHMARGKSVFLETAGGHAADQPVIERRPEIVHGLRNLIQNAVDFAVSRVWIDIDWSGDEIRLRIADDGRGYPAHLLGRIGDPFLRGREPLDLARPEYEGMGMGLFIAKTLLERTGAELAFMNGGEAAGERSGAIVTVTWPPEAGVVIGPDAGPPPEVDPPIHD